VEELLVTGAAGFIGSRVSEMLLNQGFQVIGIDNLNNYYDVNLKYRRLDKLKKFSDFTFYEISIINYEDLNEIFKTHHFAAIINLAARAGVRYSMENPFIYLSTNAAGNLNLLELSRIYGIKKYVLASTSSLYAGQKMPFKEELPVNQPISPYAASKKSAEMMAYTYHYLYEIDVSVLRYFTVYGPSGRPDMATFRFIKWIIEETPLEVYGDGLQKRDFTYVDDIAKGTIQAIKNVGFEIINLGNNHPYKLIEAIEMMEKCVGKRAKIKFQAFHKADMRATWAEISKARQILNWQPQVNLKEGIKKTVDWTKANWDWIQKIEV